MARRHLVEVVTTFGDTCLERSVVGLGAAIGDRIVVASAGGLALRDPDGTEEIVGETPLHLPCGLGTITLRTVTAAPRTVPRAPLDRRASAFLATSLAVHLVILALAAAKPIYDKPPPRTQGTPRARLVANHTTMTRARRAPIVVPSAHDVDQPTLQPLAAHGSATPVRPELDRIASQMTGAKPDGARASTPNPSTDPTRQRGEEAARHFDPCADGDCGLIPTGRYATETRGKHAGDDFQLAPREARTLATSVVECSVDGGCNTVSGSDQNEIRSQIAHHLAEVDACFTNHPDSSAAVDARIEEGGTVHVSAHDARAVSGCIADVIAKLKFSAGERDVTLAFAAPVN